MKINNVLLTALFAIALPMGAVEAADPVPGTDTRANGRDVYNLDQKVKKNESEIANLKEEVQKTEKLVKDLDPQVKKNAQLAKDNSEKIGKLNDRVKIAEDKITAAESDVKKGKDQLEANNRTIDGHSKKIAEHDKSIKDLENQRGASEADLAAATARIKEINDEKNRGLASQAALSGLFQPYTVGRMNVSAAFGGYKSEQGIAVGTGFRYSENFAVKGGVATNLKHASGVAYNVGANFEF